MFRFGRDAFRFQLPVYVYARELIVELGIKSVLDVGCGNPQKLKAYIYPFVDDLVGLDLQEVIDRIETPCGDWIGCDLNEDGIDLRRIFGLIIAADVIEHLRNPSMMLSVIKRHADDSTIILISTPEKSSVRTSNLDHVTEYTGDELVKMLEANDLNVRWSKSYTERNAVPHYISNVFLCKRRKNESDNKL